MLYIFCIHVSVAVARRFRERRKKSAEMNRRKTQETTLYDAIL